MYLLDKNIVSELRRTKFHGAVVAWIGGRADADLHVSVVTIGEIQAGIEMTRLTNPGKADEIEAWLVHVAATYNVVSMDADAFRCWAKLMHRRSDHLIENAMIAATALVCNLIIVTRNIRDFEIFGARTFDPFVKG